MFMVEISGYLIFFAPAFFSDLEEIHLNIRSWMTLRRIFPRSWLMIRRMKVPWSLQLGPMRMYLNLDMRLYYCRWLHVYALPRREDLSRKNLGVGRRLACFKLPSRQDLCKIPRSTSSSPQVRMRATQAMQAMRL